MTRIIDAARLLIFPTMMAFAASSDLFTMTISNRIAIALVAGFSGMQRMRPASAHIMFWIFAALIGLSLGSIFMVYTHSSITRVFFITAASFGALSLLGYSTQRDLSGMGSFLIMGLFGVILASLVNLFLQAPMLQFVISIVGVLVFAGLTAYDTQRLKSEYLARWTARRRNARRSRVRCRFTSTSSTCSRC